MAYDYKPGEEQDILKRYVIIGTIVVILALLLVLTIYMTLGIDREMLKTLATRISFDPTNITFVFVFVLATFALWGLLREPAASEDVQRRQTYFILLLVLAALLCAGAIYVRYFSATTHEVKKVEKCPRCDGTGRARLRPEYPCRECDGTGVVRP